MKTWGLKRIVLAAVALVAALMAIAVFVWRDDILESFLDPKVPYQTYAPPRPPDYSRKSDWALIPQNPAQITANDPPADVFFVHPTTFDGGDNWNSPIQQNESDELLNRVMLPNYAGPFEKVGRMFAPHYRQAALYAFLTLHDDARDARTFAYGDVAAAFKYYLQHFNQDRPIILVGVEQGGTLVARLARETAADPQLRARLVAVYLIDTVVPRDAFAPTSVLPGCTRRDESTCVVAWDQIFGDDPDAAKRLLGRALVWDDQGALVTLGARAALCVNPLTGSESGALAPARENLGAANATGLEWGVEPAFLPHQVNARCVDGVLHVSRPRSPSLRPSGSWADRKKAPDYNLFYADLQADAKARLAALQAIQAAR
ncbi:MAG TPA: DUF3089 domain-containing protein [Caulobacteraceae bacterium]|jgi:hypothetical protein|nr:DUF3089 domain-containing protein [Caulobacteraceae bacterium]